MFGLINTKLFLISFAIGMFFVYISEVEPKIIHIYPSPDNIDKFIYKDDAENCFKFGYQEVKCPLNPKEINNVPTQSIKQDEN